MTSDLSSEMPLVEDWQLLPARARWLFALRAIVRWLFIGFPSAVVLGIAVAVIFKSLTASVIIAGIFWFIQFIIALWGPHLAFDRTTWRIQEEGLHVVGGVWLRRETVIPLARVQHVDSRQGPIEQWFRLHELMVYTASGLGADIVLSGIEFEELVRLRSRLLSRSEEDDGV